MKEPKQSVAGLFGRAAAGYDQLDVACGSGAVLAVYVDPRRVATTEGHARTLAVNVLAPDMLTAWINRPSRLVYMSSGMHNDGDAALRDIDWTARRWNGLGYLTQTWLAGSDHPEATGGGGDWYHQRRRSPAPAALDESFQDGLLDELIRLTDVRLP